MKSSLATLSFAAALILAACAGTPTDEVDERHDGSGLGFPTQVGEFVRHEREKGVAESATRFTYARKGAFCKIAIEPVGATGTADEILAAELRTSTQVHDKTLHGELTRGGPEEKFELDTTFRGEPLHGSGVLASRDSRGGKWQTALATFIVDGWNVTLLTLERDPDRSRPPTPLASCADAFFAANSEAAPAP
jgi:hypothetical protein